MIISQMFANNKQRCATRNENANVDVGGGEAFILISICDRVNGVRKRLPGCGHHINF